jgi:alcohol dehydrogenase (NADP+)
MADLNKYIELNNGIKMPLMGFGTFLAEEEKDLIENIVYAITEVGYRHVDTAKLYNNEEAIGKALQICFEKGIKREDLFITTKLWRDSMDDPEREIKQSLEKLQLDYLDLYLIHWTVTDVDWETFEIKGPPMHEVWSNMEKLVEQGLTKSIGISNCNAMLFVDMLAGAKIKPVTNQIETNPYFSQDKFIKFMDKFGVKTTAYAPIGASGFTGNDLLEDETLTRIAQNSTVTTAQLALAWNMARGVAVIPKSMSKERIKENFEALKITLDENLMNEIDALNRDKRAFNPEGWEAPQYGWKFTPIFH